MVDCFPRAAINMFVRCLEVCLSSCRSSTDREKIISNEQDEEQGGDVTNEQEEEQGIDNPASNEQENDCDILSNRNEEDSEVVLRPKSMKIIQNRMSSYGLKMLPNEEKTDLIMLMIKKDDKHTKKKNYSVFCGTWNVNGQDPPRSDLLKKWFMREENWQPDIFVIGFQEVGKFFWGERKVESKWNEEVVGALPGNDIYEKVKSVRMARIMMFVYVKKDVLAGDIDKGKVATGILGSKGGVGMRINTPDASLCFINTHLAAHDKNVGRRNEDYRNVERKMQFGKFKWKIFDHDAVFWIGDLNYRLDGIPIDEVKAKVTKNELSGLLCNDQLLKQLGKSDVFGGYREGPIDFNPTYKFNKNSQDWDSSPKNRKPAWCDRILYKGQGIRQVHYKSHPDLMISDHKPVSSLFNVEVKAIIEEGLQEEIANIKKRVTFYKPEFKCDRREFQFKDVLLFEAKSETLTVKNCGSDSVRFKIDTCKPWLTVTPSRSEITEESCCEIRLEVLVDETCAAAINASNYKFNDTLTLSFIEGESIYITVNGNVVPSSFGCPLEALVKIREPIRNMSLDKLQLIKEGLSKTPEQKESRLIVPKEVQRLTNHILHNMEDKIKLFQHEGSEQELRDIRECLDTTLEPDTVPGSIDSVAEALLLFLKCLPEPVIPHRVHNKCLKASSNYNSCRQVIEGIDQRNKDLFEHLCAFLRNLKRQDEEGFDENIISSIFGDVLIRNSNEDVDKKKELIVSFLKNK